MLLKTISITKSYTIKFQAPKLFLHLQDSTCILLIFRLICTVCSVFGCFVGYFYPDQSPLSRIFEM